MLYPSGLTIPDERDELIAAPAVPAISTSDAKEHLRVSHTDDDAYIATLVTAATEWLEDLTGECLITQGRRYSLPAWPPTHIILPRRPVVSVDSVEYLPQGATSWSTLSTSVYRADIAYHHGRVFLRYGQTWPSDTLEVGLAVRVNYTCGYGTTDGGYPRAFKQAMLMVVAHWYEHRMEVAGASDLPRRIEFAAHSIIKSTRIVR